MRPSPPLAGLAAAAFALVLAPAGRAHVTVQPERVGPGSEPVLTFALPNEQESDVVELTVSAPAGVRFAEAEAKPGWSVTVASGRATWRGRLAPGRLATFAVSASLEQTGSRIAFDARERHADGAVERWRPALTVAADAAGPDAGSRTLGKAALFVAIAALAVAVGAGFFALYLWLRPDEPG